MKRRTIIELCARVPLLFPPLSALAATPATPAGEPPSLAGLLPDSAPARLIGERLLAVMPERPDRVLLLEHSGLGPAEPVKKMRETLAIRRTQDFAAGRTVELDGWVLARCEAALCLLLTMD